MSIEQRMEKQKIILEQEISVNKKEDEEKEQEKKKNKEERKNHPKFKEMRDIANNKELYQAFKMLSLSLPELRDYDHLGKFGKIEFSSIVEFGNHDTDCEGFGGSPDLKAKVIIEYSERLSEITISYYNPSLRSEIVSTNIDEILDQMAKDIIRIRKERESEKIREKEREDKKESERIASRPERLREYKENLLFKQERYKKRFLISMFAPIFGWNKTNIVNELTEQELKDLEDIENGRDLVDFK